ncbi:MAG: hypothetical protein EXQ94_10435 [Alphaproteobacteria bacterium]|nr:hypothetical protein [Alphaproteobacteria bacterium]
MRNRAWAPTPYSAEPGNWRDCATPFAELLFPTGAPARILIAAIAGSDGYRGAAFTVAHCLKVARHRVGLAVGGSVFIDGPHSPASEVAVPRAVDIVLYDHVVDAAVFGHSVLDLAQHGLGFDGADVGSW